MKNDQVFFLYTVHLFFELKEISYNSIVVYVVLIEVVCILDFNRIATEIAKGIQFQFRFKFKFYDI